MSSLKCTEEGKEVLSSDCTSEDVLDIALDDASLSFLGGLDVSPCEEKQILNDVDEELIPTHDDLESIVKLITLCQSDCFKSCLDLNGVNTEPEIIDLTDDTCGDEFNSETTPNLIDSPQNVSGDKTLNDRPSSLYDFEKDALVDSKDIPIFYDILTDKGETDVCSSANSCDMIAQCGKSTQEYHVLGPAGSDEGFRDKYHHNILNFCERNNNVLSSPQLLEKIDKYKSYLFPSPSSKSLDLSANMCKLVFLSASEKLEPPVGCKHDLPISNHADKVADRLNNNLSKSNCQNNLLNKLSREAEQAKNEAAKKQPKLDPSIVESEPNLCFSVLGKDNNVLTDNTNCDKNLNESFPRNGALADREDWDVLDYEWEVKSNKGSGNNKVNESEEANKVVSPKDVNSNKVDSGKCDGHWRQYGSIPLLIDLIDDDSCRSICTPSPATEKLLLGGDEDEETCQTSEKFQNSPLLSPSKLDLENSNDVSDSTVCYHKSLDSQQNFSDKEDSNSKCYQRPLYATEDLVGNVERSSCQSSALLETNFNNVCQGESYCVLLKDNRSKNIYPSTNSVPSSDAQEKTSVETLVGIPTPLPNDLCSVDPSLVKNDFLERNGSCKSVSTNDLSMFCEKSLTEKIESPSDERATSIRSTLTNGDDSSKNLEAQVGSSLKKTRIDSSVSSYQDTDPFPEPSAHESSFNTSEENSVGVKSIIVKVSDSSAVQRDERIIKCVKRRQEPWISADAAENADNFDPEWEYLRNLQTDEERYCALRKRWKNLTIPDPRKNLSVQNFRKRRLASSGSLPHDQTSMPENGQRASRKRTYSMTEENNNYPPAKRQKMVLCTQGFSNKINEYEWELDKKFQSLKAEKAQALQELRARQLTQYNQVNYSNMPLYFKQSTLRRIQYDHARELQTLHQTYSFQLQKTKEDRGRKIELLKMAKKEVYTFNKFYHNLQNAETHNKLNITEEEMNLFEENEKVFDFYDKFYRG